MSAMNRTSRICVIGIGLIGGEIARQLVEDGYKNVSICAHADLELTDQSAVEAYFMSRRPEYVFFCAVHAISDFEHESVNYAENAYANIIMQCNVIHAAHRAGVKKLILLGSAMLYPWNLVENDAPMEEGRLEEFNLPGYRKAMEPAVISKLVGLKLCQYYRRQYGDEFYYCLPTHIYGGFQNRKALYFLERLVMDICDAAIENQESLRLDVFGEGLAKKQFLHVKDCAGAIILVMSAYESSEVGINICGNEISCWKDIVNEICLKTGYSGKIYFNADREENMANRICSARKLKELGWTPQITMAEGIALLCDEYREQQEKKDE